MIEFGILKAKNIMSFGSGGFEIDLNANKLVAIKGKSGHGKSSIIEALTYCLFGKPYRNIKVGQLINSKNKKGLSTEVEFIKGNDKFRVVRTMKPNAFEIYKNEVLIDEDSASRDYQKTLEGILGFGYKTFKQICVIGSAGYTHFMLLSAGDRRSMTEELLDISIFSKMSSYFKDVFSNAKKELDLLDTKIKMKNQEKDRLISLILDLEENEESRKEEVRSRISALEIEIEALEKKQEAYTDIINQMSEKIAPHSNLSKEIGERKDQIRDFASAYKVAKTEADFFKTHDHCSVCQQSIDETHKTSIIEKNKGLMQTSKTSAQAISDELKEFEEKFEEIAKFSEAMSSASSKLQLIGSSTKEKRNTLKMLTSDLNRTSEVEPAKKQKDAIDVELQTFLDKKISVMEDFSYIEVCNLLLKDSGIKSRIISYYIPLLNQLINRYLEAFDLFVNFELDENFNETIKSRHRDDFSYESFSEGEKQRIDLSILFAWREIAAQRNSASTNILFFDETADRSLDDDSIESFVDLIRNNMNSNVLIITHRAVDPVYFDDFITVKKKSDDYSVLTSEKENA